MAQTKKVCNLEIRYLLKYDSCGPVNGVKCQLVLPEDVRRYPQRDIGRKIPNLIPCHEVEKWQWLIVSM